MSGGELGSDDRLIEQRDAAEDWADRLANRISEITGIDIGEHSNLNNPWSAALDALEELASEPTGWRPIAEYQFGQWVMIWKEAAKWQKATGYKGCHEVRMIREDESWPDNVTHFMPLPAAPGGEEQSHG